MCRNSEAQLREPEPRIYRSGDSSMRRNLGCLLIFCVSLLFPLLTAAQFAPVGGLDCNGFSKIQKPQRPHDSCADPKGLWGGPFYDNGHYIGHDEPSIGSIPMFKNPAATCSGRSRCPTRALCRQRRVLRTSSPFGLAWPFATLVHFQMVAAFRPATPPTGARPCISIAWK